MDERSDCPECRSAGSIEGGACQVCFSEVGPKASPPVPLRFADVVAELEHVAELAAPGVTGNVAEACSRAGRSWSASGGSSWRT